MLKVRDDLKDFFMKCENIDKLKDKFIDVIYDQIIYREVSKSIWCWEEEDESKYNTNLNYITKVVKEVMSEKGWGEEEE